MDMNGTPHPTQSAVQQVEHVESTEAKRVEGTWEFNPDIFERLDSSVAPSVGLVTSDQKELTLTDVDENIYLDPDIMQLCSNLDFNEQCHIGQQGDPTVAWASFGLPETYASIPQSADPTKEWMQQNVAPNTQVQVAATPQESPGTRENQQSPPSGPPQGKGAKHSKCPQRRKQRRTKKVSIEELREKKRVAASQYRRKQKDYVMHLEFRAMELENQNKELQLQINEFKIRHGVPVNTQNVG